MGIDIGIDNLLTVATNNSGDTFIINGKGLKSINKYSNKFIAHYTEIAKRMNDLYSTKRLDRIYLKRRNKINNFLHKTSKYIVDYAFKHKINTIIIGNNKGWKQDISYTSLFNQTFQQIPFKRLIKMIKYKAEKEGINVIVVNESYTSGTSFLDEEKPTKKFYDKSRRKKRGLFVSNQGYKINADINAALQIIKKYTKQSSFKVNKSIFNPRIISIS
jgi:putative transposase